MVFSELAKILYPYCGKGMRQSEFVVLLVDKIMSGRPGRAYKDGSYRNPLRVKEERALLSYFNGERDISKKDACLILSRIDKYRFEAFLRSACSDRALELLKEDMSSRVLLTGGEDIAEVCSDQLELIIKTLASRELR